MRRLIKFLSLLIELILHPPLEVFQNILLNLLERVLITNNMVVKPRLPAECAVYFSSLKGAPPFIPADYPRKVIMQHGVFEAGAATRGGSRLGGLPSGGAINPSWNDAPPRSLVSFLSKTEPLPSALSMTKIPCTWLDITTKASKLIKGKCTGISFQ